MSVAFFDIDGTLIAKPSLEQRFFWNLRGQGTIPAPNYLAWLAESIRLGPRGITAAAHANKMYLRGMRPDIVFQDAVHSGCPWLPQFFPAAIQAIWWHALRGDTIVLVSGTLTPLGEYVKRAIESELLCRGAEITVSLIATQLEVRDGCWTGRVSDRPMYAESKARAITEFANVRENFLEQCSAYGDSSLDGWMLACVGQPFAVNPTRRLRRIARLYDWPILHWTHCPVRTAREQRDSRLNFDKVLKVGTLNREGEAAR